MKQYCFLFWTLFWILGLANCSHGGGREACDKISNELEKAYEAIVAERSPDPQRVFKQFNDLRQKAEVELKNCPDSINLYSILSTVYMGLGRNKDALSCAQKALSINSESIDANNMMGFALSVLNRHSEALPYLEKAARMDPNNVAMLVNLCSTYDMAKQYDKAIEACSAIIKRKDPKFEGEALYIRARAFQATGRKKEAAEDFAAAKALGVDLSEYYTPEHLGEKTR